MFPCHRPRHARLSRAIDVHSGNGPERGKGIEFCCCGGSNDQSQQHQPFSCEPAHLPKSITKGVSRKIAMETADISSYVPVGFGKRSAPIRQLKVEKK